MDSLLSKLLHQENFNGHNLSILWIINDYSIKLNRFSNIFLSYKLNSLKCHAYGVIFYLHSGFSSFPITTYLRGNIGSNNRILLFCFLINNPQERPPWKYPWKTFYGQLFYHCSHPPLAWDLRLHPLSLLFWIPLLSSFRWAARNNFNFFHSSSSIFHLFLFCYNQLISSPGFISKV